jgi:flagellar motility protein MotE (MotC chaperone)
MKSFRNIRVIPVVVIAIASLAALKVAGLMIDGGYVFEYRVQSVSPAKGGSKVESRGETKGSWAQEMLNFPGGPKADPTDVTGSVHGAPKEAPKEEPKPAAPETKASGVVIHPEENQNPVSPSERAILERLQSRRQELEQRAREIDIRESLLKAAEKRIETKVEELRAIEQRAAAEKEQTAEAENARFKGLVTTYESMKPKDAAKVFDRLEMGVLIEIASKIAPRKMSDIMGLMAPDAAERLTVELARRAGGDKSAGASAELPKIEGKMLPQKSN